MSTTKRDSARVGCGRLVRLEMAGWKLHRPHAGCRKWIHAESQSWVTHFKGADYCNIGYRGCSLGAVFETPEYSLHEIDAMLAHFTSFAKSAKPNIPA